MKKYGNIKVVTVRQHRECCHCKTAIPNADFLSEAIGRWKQTQKGEDIFLDKRIEILGGSL